MFRNYVLVTYLNYTCADDVTHRGKMDNWIPFYRDFVPFFVETKIML